MNSISSQDAAKHLIRLAQAAKSFKGFVQALYPDFKLAPFQIKLVEALDALESGTLTNRSGRVVHRLMINMPPRHGKSWLASTLFPLYYIARKPTRHVLATSYNSDLAKTFGRQVRDHATEPLVSQAYPDFALSEWSKAANDWRTSVGGSYYATGMMGSTTGRAANLLIIDDPVKAREEAESLTQRNKNWSYYVSALLTRKQPDNDGCPPIELVILTRWHPDDLGGRIQETEDWKENDWVHISLPAIEYSEGKIKKPVSQLPPDDPRYIAPGTLSKHYQGKRYYYETVTRALWPERFPLTYLEKMKRLNEREFEALYQQSPYIKGGNLIKAGWFRTYDAHEVPNLFQSIIIAADTAFKTSEQADYSVLTVLGLSTGGDIYVLDVHRGKYEFPDLKRLCIVVNNLWRGKGLRGLYIEDKASGQSLIQELKTQSGLAVLPYKVSTDKVARANAVTPLIEGGRVFIPSSADWLDPWIDEMQQFPSSAHDDQVDSLTMGLDVLSRQATADMSLFNTPLTMESSLHNIAKQQDAFASSSFDLTSISKANQDFFKSWGE